MHEIVIGGSSKDIETRIANGWRHIYLGYGNHIAVKIEFYMTVREIFEQYDYCEVTFEWPEILKKTDFKDKIPDLEQTYNEHKKSDAVLAKILVELKQNPEYIRKVKEASGDIDKMMTMFEEYIGIKMTWFELKQFGLRQAGLI